MPNWKKASNSQTGNPKWDPQINDVLEGKLINKESNVGPHLSNLYTIEDFKGKTWSVWGKAVIDRAMGQVNVGNLVMIKYLGVAKGPKGNNFYNYDIQFADAEDSNDEEDSDEKLPF